MEIGLDEFRHWLLEQPAGSRVGLARSSHECPLARFTGQEIYVTTPLPTWAAAYRENADYIPGEIVREEALSSLRVVAAAAGAAPNDPSLYGGW